jgi:hypothetical protein
MHENIFIWKMPKSITGLTQPVSIRVSVEEKDGSAVVSLSSSHPAMYVVLTTKEQGRFTENAFFLRPIQAKVR